MKRRLIVPLRNIVRIRRTPAYGMEAGFGSETRHTTMPSWLASVLPTKFKQRIPD